MEPASGQLVQRQQLKLPDERDHYNDRMLETHSGYLLAWASGTAGRPALCRWSETERAFVFLQQLPIERASTFLELPDRSLLSGDSTGQICSWRPDTSSGGWQKAGALQAHEGPIHALANLRNGDLISAGGHEPQLKVWRGHPPCPEKWELVQVLSEHHSQIVEVMSCGPADLLSSDRGERSLLGWRRQPEVLVWSMATDKPGLVQRQNGRLRGCIEGALLLEDDGASALSLWRKSEGTYKRTTVLDESKRGNVSAFVLLPEGTLIAGGWDGRLSSWKLGAEESMP
jgi:WD40 repeat protein